MKTLLIFCFTILALLWVSSPVLRTATRAQQVALWSAK